MLPTRHAFLASPLLCALALSAAFVTARGQTTSLADTKLALKAALVLTPEFCETRTKKGSSFTGKDTFEIGKAACAELEPALKGVFFSLTRVAAASSSEDAQVVLVPRFVDVDATAPGRHREILVLFEWTVKDKSGRTVWIETVQGSATHRGGSAFSRKKNLNLMVEDSVKDAAEQSASKMSSSPELRKLTQ